MKKTFTTSLVIIVAVVALLGFNNTKRSVRKIQNPSETIALETLQPIRFSMSADAISVDKTGTYFAHIKAVGPSNKEITLDKIKVSIEGNLIRSEVIYLESGNYKLKSFKIVSEGNPSSGVSASFYYPINSQQTFLIKQNKFLAC